MAVWEGYSLGFLKNAVSSGSCLRVDMRIK